MISQPKDFTNSMDFVCSVCVEKCWERNNVLDLNLKNYFEICNKNKVQNNELLENSIVMNSEYLPTSEADLGLCIALWKTPKHVKELMDISEHPASTSRNLRNLGFIFKKETTSKNHCWKENGKTYREIIDFEEPFQKSNASWNRISKEERTVLKRIFNKDFLGNSAQVSTNEIDHRMPEHRRRTLGKPSIPLTTKNLLDGTWFDTYQLLSKKSNDIKRQACEGCENGKEIELPLSVSAMLRFCYKIRFDEDKNGCVGCFWFDSLRPKIIPENEEIKNALVFARKGIQTQLDLVKEEVIKLKRRKGLRHMISVKNGKMFSGEL